MTLSQIHQPTLIPDLLVEGLKHLLALGPTEVGEDYLELASGLEPQPLVGPDVRPQDVCSVGFTGGTTGKPKGVLQTYAANAYLTMIQQAEWEFPDDLRMLVATPLSHAAAAFFIPVLRKGGGFYVMQGFSPDGFSPWSRNIKLPPPCWCR